MEISISSTSRESGVMAAKTGAEIIKKAIKERGKANVILATGASQFDMLNSLISLPDIDWSKVTAFHLDEYIGIPITHPASFRKYLKERFEDKVPALNMFHYIAGDTGNPEAECERVGDIIRENPIDAAFIGIGENCHLAFNDPPADFNTEKPYIVVNLDEGCRKQQMGEGWFKDLESVPEQAISMGIKQIMKSGTLIVTVPDKRKAEAVKNACEQEVSNIYPASIIQNHSDCTIYLDADSASLLSK